MNDRNAAFERLLADFTDSYMDRLFCFCLKKTNDPHEAEDLASDIALNVIAALQGGTVPENFSAWVWQITRNRYSLWAKKKRRLRDRQVDADIAELELGDDADGPLEELIDQEALSLLRRELAFIPSDYRSIVVAHYHDGRSAVEIARELGLPEGTVRSKLYHARRILKEGMRMKREFGKLSYAPGYIGFVLAGSGGQNGEPMCFLKRKICKNILFAAWRTPMTAQELAIEIGLALPYMEEELQLLVDAEIMKKCGDRYAVAVPIVSALTVERIKAHLGGIIPEITQALIDALECKLAWLDGYCTGWHGGFQSREHMKMALLLEDALQLHQDIRRRFLSMHGKSMEIFALPERPYNGRWNVVGLEGMLITELWPICNSTVNTPSKPWLPYIDFRHFQNRKEIIQPKIASAPTVDYALIEELVKVAQGRSEQVDEIPLHKLLDCGYIRKTESGYEPTVCVVYHDRIKPPPPELKAACQEKRDIAGKLGLRHYEFCRKAYAADMSDFLRGNECLIDVTADLLAMLESGVFEEARRIGYLQIEQDQPNDGLGTLLAV